MNNPAPRPSPRPRPRPRPGPGPAGTTPPAPVSPARPGKLTFGPDWRTAIVAIAGAGFAALVAILASDPVQRAFAAAVVVALLAIAAADAVFAPRLTVTEEGIRVHAPFDRARLPWSDIDAVVASSARRLGVRTSILEISAGERLLVLDRRDLAADPWAVANRIAEFRASSPGERA